MDGRSALSVADGWPQTLSLHGSCQSRKMVSCGARQAGGAGNKRAGRIHQALRTKGELVEDTRRGRGGERVEAEMRQQRRRGGGGERRGKGQYTTSSV